MSVLVDPVASCLCSQIPSNMDKTARLLLVQDLFQRDIIYSDEVIDQVASFPRGAHDDLVDVTSMTVLFLRDDNMALRPKEHKGSAAGFQSQAPAAAHSLRCLTPLAALHGHCWQARVTGGEASSLHAAFLVWTPLHLCCKHDH